MWSSRSRPQCPLGRSPRKGFIPALLALVVFILPAGVEAVSRADRARVDLLRYLEGRGLDPERVIQPFELTDEMREWVHAIVPRKIPDEKKLELLLEALFDPENVALEYSRLHTGTAQEVFEERQANCLAFTNLFLGMARELDVPVHFLAVKSRLYRKEADLVLMSDHIAVGHRRGVRVHMYDFSAEARDDDSELPDVSRITDYTAVAMFYSNRGAEEMQAGNHGAAVGWLRTAVDIDPDLASAWNNLGVAFRRVGQAAEAERAYRKSIEVDPKLYSSYQNLAALLHLEGRKSEAHEIEQLLSRAPNRNPYTYMSLGDISFKNARLDEARRFYRRAVQLSETQAEPFAALGELAAKTGDLKTARRMLKKALKIDRENPRVRRLADLIAGL